jgi:hypothetical protein
MLTRILPRFSNLSKFLDSLFNPMLDYWFDPCYHPYCAIVQDRRVVQTICGGTDQEQADEVV